ncbi:hypothetical protein SUDANB120_03426 [Streptomyces sp. enrichment culture]|uniref:VOC family protein n=1 Tax=Streptomyces sp. enrichment culture TaxID=1795815 RepID=UPI003F543AF0
MRVRLHQIVVDCREPGELVRFWAELFGVEPVERARGWFHVKLPGVARLAFQPAPEGKSAKNRLHLDLAVDDLPAAVARAVALGAAPAGGTITDDQGSFQTMRDPEGNEFCLVTG